MVSAPVSSGPACSSTAPATRDVWCGLSDGTRVADARCTGQKPAANVTAADYRTCTFRWTTSDWSTENHGGTCGPYIQFRTVYCVRSDGETTSSSDNDCDQASKPDREQNAYDYSGCTYAWTTGEWSAPSTTCGDATQTRTVTCQRSDGSDAGDGACAAAGPKPPLVQTSHQVAGCATSWTTGDWTTAPACGATVRTRPISCLRSDGATVGNDQCASQPVPETSAPATDYSACTYAWTASYGAWASTCSDSTTRPVSSSCQRSDGTAADASLCNAATRPATTEAGANYTSCAYTWTPSYGSWSSTCSPSASRTVTYACTRGTPVPSTAADSFCEGAAKGPASQTQQVLDSCSFTPGYTFGACTNGSKTGTLSSCTATAKDGSQFAAPLSSCSPQTTTQTCAPVIANGDFATANSGWTVDLGSVTYGRVPNGTQGLVLTAIDNTAAGAYQVFTTVPGTTYQLTYTVAIMPNPKGVSQSGNLGIQVFDVASKKTYYNDRSSSVATTRNGSFTFTALSSSTEIYLGVGTIASGYQIRAGFDNIVATPQ